MARARQSRARAIAGAAAFAPAGPDFEAAGPDFEAAGPDFEAAGPDFEAAGPDFEAVSVADTQCLCVEDTQARWEAARALPRGPRQLKRRVPLPQMNKLNKYINQ